MAAAAPARHPGARPFLLPAVATVLTGAVLVADARTASLQVQLVLGVFCFAVLALVTRRSTDRERRQVWICVGLSTLVELFGSVLWGAYRYRLGNVPLYVPPGHGLVYLTAMRLAVAPAVIRHERWAVRAAVTVAVAWGIAGVTALPWRGDRLDTLGLLFLPVYLAFVRFTPRARLFAAAFLATSLLELAGTALGTWTWAVTTPVVPFHCGNPPSVIAGAYCILDAGVLVSHRGLLRLVGRRREAAVVASGALEPLVSARPAPGRPSR